jgi:hypothetical protein
LPFRIVNEAQGRALGSLGLFSLISLFLALTLIPTNHTKASQFFLFQVFFKSSFQNNTTHHQTVTHLFPTSIAIANLIAYNIEYSTQNEEEDTIIISVFVSPSS